MSTIDELNKEILKLRKKNEHWEETLLALEQQRTKQLSAKEEQKLAFHINSIDKRISENNQLISENNQIIIEKEKQIAADKEAIAADKKAIAADKEKDAARAKFREERGETNTSPMLFIFFP